jgi:hypothetical protein
VGTAYDTAIKAEWNRLTPRDRRLFLSLIAEPDEHGCSAWLGQTRRGYPEWDRIDRESRIRIRGQARRLVAQSHGIQLGDRDLVAVTCENAGCMTWDHLAVERHDPLQISEKEKRAALQEASGRTHHCADHPGGRFRACFSRPNGRVKVYFKCVGCDRRRNDELTAAAREFKELRHDF